MKLNIQLFAGSVSIGTITETTDINTNQSTFSIPATMTTSGQTFNNDNAYMTLQWKYASGSDWTTISKKTFGIGQNTSKTKNWSLTLTHNADGTLENINFRVKWYITSSTNGTSSTKTASPTTIPRASEIDSMNNATTQDYPTIKWTPKSSAFKYKVKYLSEDGTTYEQSSLISPNRTTQYSYNGLIVPNDFFTNVKSSDTQTATAILYTYQSDGTTLVGQNSTTFTVTLISNVKPHVWIENITDVGTTPSGWNVLLKGKSKIRYDVKYYFSPPVPESATITSNTNGQNFSESATISTSTQTKQLTTSFLNTTGSNSISARVTDSRTRYADAATQTYTVVDYSDPSISEAKAKRVNSSNVEDDNGTYLNITFKASITSVSNKNTNIFRVGYREKGIGSYTYKTLINNDKTTYSLGNTYVDYRITDWTLNTNKQYDITFEAIDSFTPTQLLRQIDTGFDLMNFNTNGKAMAIGKVSEAGANEAKLEVAMDLYNNALDLFNDTSGSDWKAMMKNKIDYCINNMNTNKTNASMFINGGWSGVNFGFGIFSKIGTVYQLQWFSNSEMYYVNKIGNNYSYYNGYNAGGMDEGSVGTASGKGTLIIKKANNSEAPNNGVVLEYGNWSEWTGQLYIGDNGTQGIWFNGWNNGVRGIWRKLMPEPIVLFSGFSNGQDVQLSDDINNYEYVEIEYGNTWDSRRVERFIRSGNYILENRAADMSSSNFGFVDTFCQYQNNGTTLKFIGAVRVFKYLNGTNWSQDTYNTLNITKIWGYKTGDIL